MKTVSILGARPQFVKAKTVSSAFDRFNQMHLRNGFHLEDVMVHTGQHYDYQMSDLFFRTLSLPDPKYHLGVGSGKQGWQTAEILKRTEDVLDQEQPDAVIVYGDTNSTMAGALAGAKLNIPVVHVEAGLRSFRRDMPEENNRIVTDHLSSLLFAPTQAAVRNLHGEGITGGVHLVGDVMLEAALHYREIAQRESQILQRLALTSKQYSLVTIHRAENADNPHHLGSIVAALKEISQSEVFVWPVHPRTAKKLEQFKLNASENKRLRLIEPVSYLDMLALESSARVVLTDSGGVQKEAVWFGVPCITLREETEWIETIEGGGNCLAGANTEKIVDLFRALSKSSPKEINLNRQKTSVASAIVEILIEWHKAGKETIR